MNLALFCLVTFAAACGLTGVLRRYAQRRQIIDVPNERSSHSVPTPRGGGVAIVVAFVAALTVWSLPEFDSAVSGLIGSGLLVAVVGFLDDHMQLRAGWRLILHFAAAVVALVAVGGLPPVPFVGTLVDWGLLGQLLSAVYLVWLLNLYNFMDGIDGIAGVEAVTVACGGALLSWLTIGDLRGTAAPLLLAAAAAGFFVWNFPKARIFMGDAGSGFLGFVLGVFSISAAWHAPQLIWTWVILLGVFVVDATMTLLRRMARREALHQAHRSHAYQYASRLLRSHQKVTLAVCAINLAWLLPWAYAVARGAADGLTAVAIAYLPLIVAAWRLHAGAREKQSGA